VLAFEMQVDSMNKNGILLEVLQVLSDLDLHIFKAYITSDGGWFMDGKIYILLPPRSTYVSLLQLI
jgi:UTP:GlnB (protein PII) uridylyltransferase